ncbi:MAG: long-chain fatty acid--CoA ligase [Desulfobacterales bacterium]
MIRSMNIAWWVQRWSDLHPDKCAIIFEKERITYSGLNKRANRTSCWLQSLGIAKGDRVAVMLNNCPEFIELFLACARLGAIFVPLNFRSAPPELDYFLKNCRPRLFVFGNEFMDKVKTLDLENTRPQVLLSTVGKAPIDKAFLDYIGESAAHDGRKPFLTRSLGPTDPEESQVIMYTSGTTGWPKGAVLSHRKTFFNCLNADIFFKMHFDDVMLVILPLFHSGGLFIQASPTIYKGATMVIHPKFDAVKVYRDIECYKVTKLLGVPTVYQALVEVDPQDRGDISSLKVCAGGGEKTTPELFERCRQAGLAFRQVMGQTETSILLWASEEDSFRKPDTVGRPVFHAEVNIVDKSGRPVRVGDIGEIVVGGSIMMKEYWQDPVGTEETIRNGMLYTGDLARMDEEGYYFLVDRARDMYIAGGENVYPAEVERVLREHPQIEDIAVVGVPDDKWGEVGQAFVIPKKGVNFSADSLIDFCKARMAAFKCPRKVMLCKEFPRTSLGKVRKRELVKKKSSQQ